MSRDILTIDLDEIKAKKGKELPSPKRQNIGSQSTISRTVRKAPEVMIKITSSGKNMQSIRGTVNYISQAGEVVVEDESGNHYIGKKVASEDALYRWRNIPESGTARRESLHLIFSMPKSVNPAETPRDEVTEAVRRFAANEWADYQYLFAQHNDTEHAHTHVVLNMNPIRGTQRLNPRKADLQRWRERFAEQLQALGVNANATPRRARGVTQRGTLQAVVAMDERAKAAKNAELGAEVTKSAVQAARSEVDGKPYNGVPRERLHAVRAAVVDEYARSADELKQGDELDKQLARDIEQFVQDMPPIVTRHDEWVRRIEAGRVKRHDVGHDKAPEQGRGPER